MTENIDSVGGCVVDGDVGVKGGDFIGRDSSTINASGKEFAGRDNIRTDINLSLDERSFSEKNNDYLQRLYVQIARLEDDTRFGIWTLQQKLEAVQRDLDKQATEMAQLRHDYVLVRLSPPVTSQPMTNFQVAILLISIFAFLTVLGFALYLVIRGKIS